MQYAQSMKQSVKSTEVIIEEVTFSFDPQRFQIVAYPAPEGVVLVVQEWPCVQAEE
jgi:hypothetical protein